MLRDNGPAWRYHIDYVQLKTGETDVVKLPTDEWPTLPRLLVSAQEGCGFCAFLREAILSHKFSDAWEHLADGRITKSDPARLDLELWYRRETPPFSRYLSFEVTRYLRYMMVRVTFDEVSSVLLHFELEGVAGQRLNPALQVQYYRLLTCLPRLWSRRKIPCAQAPKDTRLQRRCDYLLPERGIT